MSCPAVIDVYAATGPVVADVVTPGPPGPVGSRWITGVDVPSPSIGAVGDFYLRQNGDVYGPKASEGWGAVQFTLTGSGGASLSDSTPQGLGTAAAGNSVTASRSDHRHAMPSAQQVGADPQGTAAAAVTAHLQSAPHLSTQQASAAAPVQSVALSGPAGWSTQTASTGGGVTLTFGLPSGQTLLALADKTSWDAAAVLATTAVQPSTLTTALATKADLVGGVIPTSQIPAIAISDYLGAVASQAAMLALTGQRGDWCLRTDPSAAGMWVLSGDNAALLANWVQIPVPTVPVQSINGQTGIVTLGTSDIQESGGSLYFTASRAIGAALTGFSALAGTVAATDSILQAFQKVVGNIANRALSGLIGSSNLTMNSNRLAGRITASVGAVEEITPAGGMVLVNGNLVPGEIVKLVVSNIGETGITTGNFKNEVRIDRAFTLLGVWWSCNPTAMGTASTSDARPYIRTSADTTSAGTRTNILTTASSIASLPASVHTVDATSSINGGTISGSPGDWLGVDLMSVGTASSGHSLTFILRYS